MYEKLEKESEIYVDFLSPHGHSTLKNFKSHLLFKYSEQEILSFLKHDVQPVSIPVCIFSKQLSLLEAIVKYLKENRGLGFAAIARLLNRAPSTISTTYAKAKKKMPKPILVSESQNIPVSAISNRKVSTFEAIVLYLHRYSSFPEIAALLSRDNRVVWEIHKRAVEKIEPEKFFTSIKKTQDIAILKTVKQSLKQKYSIDFIKLFRSIPKQELVPIQIFKEASPLRALVSYLKGRGWSTKKISDKLNRSAPVISAAVIKTPKVTDFTHSVPLTKLSDRNFSLMENVVSALLTQGLSVGEIALALNRSQPVISKFKQRWKKKSEEQ